MEGSEAGPAGGCSSLLTRLPLRWAGRGMHTDNSLRHISPMASSGLLEATSTGSAPDGYKAFSARRSSALVSDNPFVPLDRHLAQNPFICDCNLKWLADFLRTNPIETSGARCASPRRLANKRIGQIKSKKFRCSGKGHLCISSGLGDQECVLMALTKMSSVTFEPAGCRGGGGCIQLGWDGSSALPLTLLQPGGGRLAEAMEGDLPTPLLPGQLFSMSLCSRPREHLSEVGDSSRTKMETWP